MIGNLSDSESRNLIFEAGRILGYPECCVEHFVNLESGLDGNTVALYDSYGRSETVPSLLLASHFRLIEHLPCSYSCAASMERAIKAMSLTERQGKSGRSFVQFINGIQELMWLCWSTWKVLGFINPGTTGDTITYDSFYVFDGPAKSSFRQMEEVVKIALRADAFSLNEGSVAFYSGRGLARKTTAVISDDFHILPPRILKWGPSPMR
jgi:hypothetical protein